MTARTAKAWIPRGRALVFSLLVLGATSGDLGHVFAGGTWHGLEMTLTMVGGEPAEPNSPGPISSHLGADCPLCRVGRTSSAALSEKIAYLTPLAEKIHAAFLLETSAPSSLRRRADAARAPPARLST